VSSRPSRQNSDESFFRIDRVEINNALTHTFPADAPSASATLMSASRSGKSFPRVLDNWRIEIGIPPGSSIHHFYSMNDAFAAQNLRRFAEIIANV